MASSTKGGHPPCIQKVFYKETKTFRMPLIPPTRRSRMLSKRINTVLANNKFSYIIQLSAALGHAQMACSTKGGYPLRFGFGSRFRKAQRFR